MGGFWVSGPVPQANRVEDGTPLPDRGGRRVGGITGVCVGYGCVSTSLRRESFGTTVILSSYLPSVGFGVSPEVGHEIFCTRKELTLVHPLYTDPSHLTNQIRTDERGPRRKESKEG